MTMSRGGETGGASIKDALREYEGVGYSGQFAARPSGIVECLTCKTRSPAEKVARTALRRVEGASDPDDMVSINALVCPACGTKGTAVFKYGPAATPEEGEVMRRLNAVHLTVPETEGPHGSVPGAETLLDPAEARRPRMRSDVDDDTFPPTPHTASDAAAERADDREGA